MPQGPATTGRNSSSHHPVLARFRSPHTTRRHAVTPSLLARAATYSPALLGVQPVICVEAMRQPTRAVSSYGSTLSVSSSLLCAVLSPEATVAAEWNVTEGQDPDCVAPAETSSFVCTMKALHARELLHGLWHGPRRNTRGALTRHCSGWDKPRQAHPT